jgi:hypothetical protein
MLTLIWAFVLGALTIKLIPATATTKARYLSLFMILRDSLVSLLGQLIIDGANAEVCAIEDTASALSSSYNC